MRILAILLLFTPAVCAQDAPLWVAVGAPELTAALAPLAEHRKAEGFDVRILAPSVVDALKTVGRVPAYLVLVGDDGEGAPFRLPAPRRDLYRWRSDQKADFAADAAFGDADGDLWLDYPVGRIPARTPQQVKAVVEKTLAFERRPARLADLRILAWGGASGYGEAMDAMATAMLVNVFRQYTPEWAGRFLISSVAGNPFCGWPPDQPMRFNEELGKGALLAAFLAHANEQFVLGMHTEDGTIGYGIAHARSGLAAGPPAPPLFFSTCLCGRFDGPNNTLAEEMLFLPGGPVATIAATTESHPLTNYYSGRCLLTALGGESERMGDVWLHAQREAREASEFLVEKMLADVEGKLEEHIDIEKLKRDQMLLYAYLGDPAVKLKLPAPLAVEVTSAEDGWHWQAKKPAGATAIHVGLRPLRPPRVRSLKVADPDAARKLLDEANAAEGFAPLPAPQADARWEGVVSEPGILRIVAETPGRLQVFVRKL